MITKQSYKIAKWFYDNYRADSSFSPIALDFEENLLVDEKESYTIASVNGVYGDKSKRLKEELHNMYDDSTTLIRCIEYLIDEGVFKGYIQNHSDGFTIRQLSLSSAGVRLVEGAENSDSFGQVRNDSARVFNISLVGGVENVGLINAGNNKIKLTGFNTGFIGWIKSKIFKK